MAKKQLKKANQPKKYLQGGSNMGSVSMMRQNPYYVGQVNQDAAEENLANMQEQVMQNKQTAAQAKKDARDMQNQQLDETIRNNTSNIIKGVATDQKAGRLGSLFTRGPLSGQAAMNISAGTQIAPIYAAPATTTVASNVGSLAPGAVEVGANLANTSTNVVSGVNAATAGVPAAVAPTGEFVTQGIASGAKGAAGLSSLATAGIGAAAMIGGKVIQKRADDNSAYTFTDKERRGNVGGSALSSAGTGFSTGAMIGSIVPGIGNVVGGAIGAGIGAGIGALKARKENKAAEEEAQRLQREQAAMRGAFQGAFVNSRLTGADTGFGLNSSTNMNNQFTNQYQVAKTGGVRKFAFGGETGPCPPGSVPNANGDCIKDLSIPPLPNSSLANYYTTAVSKYGEDIAQKMLKNRRTCNPGEECWEETKIEQPNRRQFDLKSTGDASIDRLNASMFGNKGANTDNGYIPLNDPKYNPYKKTGGVTGIQEDRRTKKVPGGKIVPIEGTDAVEFIGRSHAKGGVTIDKNTEVEGGETMDQVAMNDNNKQDYIFSKYLKLGGKSFAQRHKEILKGSGSQAEIQQLAAMQEKVAGRNPQQVAAYGGFHKYLDGGVKPCPECPPNTVCNPATGECVADEETNNSYDWNATGLEGFKAGQNAATSAPPKPAGKQVSQADYDFYIREQNAKLADQQRQIAAQNGTSNAPADAVVPTSKPKGWGAAGAPSSQIDQDQPAYTDPAGVQPPANTQPAAQATLADDIDKMWADKGYVKNADGDWVLPEEVQQQNTAPAYTPPAGVKPAAPNNVDPKGNKLPDGYVWDATLNAPVSVAATSASTNVKGANAPNAAPTGVTTPPTTATGTQTPANTSNVQGGVGATTTTDKLVGSKTSGFLPTFENAKENPLWTKENYPAWKSEVQSAIGDVDRQQKIVDYLLNYKGDYSAEVQKRIKGKTGQDLLTTIQNLATDNKPGIFHEAVRQALEATKPPAVEPPSPPVTPPTTETPTQELPKKYEPCPPGTYRSGDGSCKPVGDVPQASRISGSLMAGLGQLIPVGAALANPYKIASGIMGTAAIKGALLPRVNMNQERASNIQQNVAYKNAVINQNAGPGALAAMQMANTKTNEQMLKIAQQEQAQNRQLAGDEAKLGMQASMFNVETDQKRQMFNKEFNKDERRYRREDILGALDTAAARVAGIFKDDRSYKAQERLATALDETGSYDRFSILEQLNKDAKRKGSPYYGTTETERRRIAAAMHKELNPEGYIGMSEYNKLQEEKAKLQKEKEELEKEGKAKFGGARQYVSRLGQLSGVRATKAKL